MNAALTDSSAFLAELLKAELYLTLYIVAGVAAGEIILAAGVVERLFAPLMPLLARVGIRGKIAAAMLMALGTPRPAAALISGAYSDGELTRREATYGTLALAFPAYLRRWAVTAAGAASIAGKAGFIFACVIIARSACRFVWVVALLARESAGRAAERATAAGGRVEIRGRVRRARRMLIRSLPLAWLFFALTYALVPFVDGAFAKHAARWRLYGVMPAEGWAVAVSSIAHVNAGLSAAAGALGSGRLSVRQAVLALLVGNFAGSVTRTLRQNVGYWVGIFPGDMVPGLLRWHLLTNVTLEILSILMAWCASEVIFSG
jgi:hypothetical protein